MEINWQEKIERVSKLYSPTAPIKEQSLFQGRVEQLGKIDLAVREIGQHIIVYGDRGVGKTSLANIVGERYRVAINSLVSCNANSTLSGLWKTLFKRIPVSVERYKVIGFSLDKDNEEKIRNVITLADGLDPRKEIDVDEINTLLSTVNSLGYKLLFIFDEFDQIRNESLVADISNIIKFCSDHLENITIMVVGIGKSVTDLINNHQSIERATKQIFLQRMSDDELKDIVTKANTELGLQIDRKVLNDIVSYSSGYPHYTHLLAKFATLNALTRGSNTINDEDFKYAVNQSIENANESIRRTYEKAVITSKAESYFPVVLTACALVETDEHGAFRLTDIKDVLKNEFNVDLDMQGYQYHIGKFCTDDRGNILEKIDVSGASYKYKFINPLFRSYVILKHYKNKCCI